MKQSLLLSFLAMFLLSAQLTFAQGKRNQAFAGFTSTQVVSLHKGKNILSTPQQQVQVKIILSRDLEINQVFLIQDGKAHKMKLKRGGSYHYKAAKVSLKNVSGNPASSGRQKNRRVEMEVVFE